MNIVCLYWIPHDGPTFRGRDFSIQDVERLADNVARNMDCPYNFYVLTNYVGDDLGFDTIPLQHNFPGWWSKMELHRPDLPEGRTLYLDLDTHIVGNLQPILDYSGDLVMFKSIFWTVKPQIVRRYQAATMLFDSGTPVMTEVWDRFISNPNRWMKEYRSDQDVMGDWIPDQKTFPKAWMMKLGDCLRIKALPNECIIVTGQPRNVSFRDTDKFPWHGFNQIAS